MQLYLATNSMWGRSLEASKKGQSLLEDSAVSHENENDSCNVTQTARVQSGSGNKHNVMACLLKSSRINGHRRGT